MVQLAVRATIISFAVPLAQSQVNETFVQKSECKWFIEEARFQVRNLKIVVGDAATQCPFERFGADHHEACNACARLHEPCRGIFAACPGCCFTSGPGPMKASMCNRVPQHHTCDDFQNWFSDHTLQLNCTDTVSADSYREDASAIPSKLTVDIVEPLAEGTLETRCAWTARWAKATEIPTKIKVDCTDCAIKAVPDLLQKCCDMGLDLANGEVMQNLRNQGLAPQLWIDGCHSPHLLMDDHPYWVAFPNYTKYEAYTEARADERMRESVERNHCANGVAEDASKCMPWEVVKRDDPACDRRLRGNVDMEGAFQCSDELEIEPLAVLSTTKAMSTAQAPEISTSPTTTPENWLSLTTDFPVSAIATMSLIFLVALGICIGIRRHGVAMPLARSWRVQRTSNHDQPVQNLDMVSCVNVQPPLQPEVASSDLVSHASIDAQAAAEVLGASLDLAKMVSSTDEPPAAMHDRLSPQVPRACRNLADLVSSAYGQPALDNQRIAEDPRACRDLAQLVSSADGQSAPKHNQRSPEVPRACRNLSDIVTVSTDEQIAPTLQHPPPTFGGDL